jgi:hypothetical protein
MDKIKGVLLFVVVVLVCLLGVSFGYILNPKNSNTSLNPVNNSSNITNQTNGTPIPYSSEYLSFNKAKSIAKDYAGKGVVTSDPILLKDKNGNAIYYCDYIYNGVKIGGIIINAKTGEVLWNIQNIPATTNNNYNTDYSNQDTSQSYDDTSPDTSDSYDDTSPDTSDSYDDTTQETEEDSDY